MNIFRGGMEKRRRGLRNEETKKRRKRELIGEKLDWGSMKGNITEEREEKKDGGRTCQKQDGEGAKGEKE